jgi:DNA-binding transcriptional LysR family regulator
VNLKNLEAFYWVVILNSFNKAAQKLQTTQPAISQKITAIEHDLGFKVLDRNFRHVKPTSKGLILFKYAEKFMRLETDLVTELIDNHHLAGTIRLGVSETIVYTWLTKYMEKVQEEFPYVSIEIVVSLTPELQQGVQSGHLDMAFSLGSTLMFECVEQPLCSFDLCFLAAPTLPGIIGQMSLKDLMSYTVLTYPRATYPYIELKSQFKEKNVDEPLSITSYSLEILLRLAEQGLGIAIVPKLTATQEILEGRLEVLNTPVQLQPLNFIAIYTQGDNAALKEKLTELAISISNKEMTLLKDKMKG